MINTIGLFLFALLLSGCLLGQDYERPDLALPTTFRSDAEQSENLSSLGELQWWELFKDDDLHRLIDTAMQENKDLRLAVTRVNEARGQYGVARGALLPQATVLGSASRTKIPSSSIPGLSSGDSEANDSFLTAAGLSYELDLWGRLRRAREAAWAELLASEEARKTVVMTLVGEVAQAYFELQALDLQLAIAKRTLATRLESLKLIAIRQKHAFSSDFDLRRAEAQEAEAAAEIPRLEQLIVQQENRLRLLLGQNPGAIVRHQALNDKAVPPIVPAGLPSSLLERRPDIRQAEVTLVAANARIGEAKAAFFPQIRLTGAYGFASSDLADLFTGQSQLWSYGPTVIIPFFQGGTLRANLSVAEAREQAALIEYEKAIQQAFREVDDALITYQKTGDRQRQQERLVQASRDSVDLAMMRYKGGISDYLEVLDTQRQLFSAEIQLAETRQARLVSVVHLYKALGGGWSSESDTGRAAADQDEGNS